MIDLAHPIGFLVQVQVLDPQNLRTRSHVMAGIRQDSSHHVFKHVYLL